MPSNIAVVGQFAAGKTTVANVLVEEYGFTRLSLARGIKEMAARLYNGGQPIDKNGTYEVTNINSPLSGREVLQQLGQVVKSFDRDFWLRWLVADMAEAEGPFVIDDCRFPFEADFLSDNDFVIVKIDTPEGVRLQRYYDTYGRFPTASELNHPSETEVASIEPDWTLSGLARPSELAHKAFMFAADPL